MGRGSLGQEELDTLHWKKGALNPVFAPAALLLFLGRDGTVLRSPSSEIPVSKWLSACLGFCLL